MQILSILYCDNIPENKKDLDDFLIDYGFYIGYGKTEYIRFRISSDNENFERALELKNCRIGMTMYEFSKEELDSAKWLYLGCKCQKFDINEDIDTFEFEMCPKSENTYHYKRQINPYVLTSRVKWKPKNNFYSAYGVGDDIFCSPEAVSQFKQNNIIGIDFGVVNRKDGTARDDIYQMLFTEKLIRETIYIISTPFMYDAAGEESFAVFYDLSEKDGEYILTVSADNTWINDSNRVYPVVIDPSVTETEINYCDTYIYSSNPDTNYGTSANLWVSPSRITYMKTGMPTLPTYAKITYASLTMNYYYYVTSGSLDIGLYRCMHSWGEYSLTWNTANSWDNKGLSSSRSALATATAVSGIGATNPRTITFSITPLVKQWYAGGTNYGVGLKYETGSNISVIIHSYESTSIYRAYYEITYNEITPIIENGIYYQKNKETNRYVDIEISMTEGAYIHQWDYHGGKSQRWIFTYTHNDNYYTIKADNSSTTFYLGVKNDSTATDARTILRSGLDSNGTKTISDGMLWGISTTSSGAYKIRAITGESGGNDRVLAVGWYLFNVNGIDVDQRDYVNDTNYKDEWYLIKARAYSIGGEFHSGDDVIDASNNWTLCGYNSSYNINPTAGCLNQNNLSSTVVYFSSHGSQHRIKLLNNVYLTDGLVSLPTNGVAINSVNIYNPKLYIYDACLTASDEDGTGKNLCTQTLAQGVECVIGWRVSIGATDARNWQERFQGKLVQGYTVLQAANYANSFSYNNNTTIKDWRIFGNDSVIINSYAAAGVQRTNPVDDCLNTINYDIDTKNIETIEDEIVSEIESFGSYTYEKTVTYTNDTYNNYVIDYVCKFNGYNTDNGYTLIVENSKALCISKHMQELPINDSRKPCVPTNSVNSRLISEALNYAREQSNDPIVLNQSYDFYYDITNDAYFCRVMTTTSTEDGCCSAYFTFYSL